MYVSSKIPSLYYHFIIIDAVKPASRIAKSARTATFAWWYQLKWIVSALLALALMPLDALIPFSPSSPDSFTQYVVMIPMITGVIWIRRSKSILVCDPSIDSGTDAV